jgi:hypothetical protein
MVIKSLSVEGQGVLDLCCCLPSYAEARDSTSSSLLLLICYRYSINFGPNGLEVPSEPPLKRSFALLMHEQLTSLVKNKLYCKWGLAVKHEAQRVKRNSDRWPWTLEER